MQACLGFPGGSVVNNPPANAGDTGSILGSGRCPGEWQPTPVLLPGKSHGQRNLVGCSPWGHKKSRTPLRDGALTHVTITANKEGEIKDTSPGKERKVSTKTAACV